jgi:hypothetical protein
VVIGDADPYYDPALLDRMRERGADVLVLVGVDHGLNVGVDAVATLRAMELYTSELAAFMERSWGYPGVEGGADWRHRGGS